MNLQLFAPCYGPPGTERIADRLRHSAKHFSYPDVTLYMLGMLSPGSPHGGEMQGVYIIEEMKRSTAELVICSDASDVLFTGPMDEMLEKFLAFDSPFVIGTEMSSHVRGEDIETGMTRLWKESGHRYGALNIGYWIGYREYAIELLQKSIDLYRGTPNQLDNPQAWLPMGLVRDTLVFTLDRNAVLFQPAEDMPNLRIENGRLHNVVTDTWPSMIHFNGSGGNLGEYDKFYREIIR